MVPRRSCSPGRISRTAKFGYDIGSINHPERYGIFVLVLAILAVAVIANVRRGRSGRRLIAAGHRLELLSDMLERAAGVGIHHRFGDQEPELRSHDARVSRAGGQDRFGCSSYTLACGLLLLTAPSVAANPF